MEIELKEAASAEDVLVFADAILSGEPNLNANLANLAALLNQYLPRINWVGFYIRETVSGDWVLGPFAGKPACTRIAQGQGVVGAALANQRTLIVDDVLSYPGHIACDADSRSEIVVPIVAAGSVAAGLDVDSPEYGRFSPGDAQLLEAVCRRLGESWLSCRWY
jgi:GAF domain-containing protein